MMTSTKEIPSIDSLNWLYHMHYIRGEFEMVQKQVSRFGFTSDYATYLIGLIKLRQEGDAKTAMTAFSGLPLNQDQTYVKAMARCHILNGNHTQAVEILKEHIPSTSNDWQVWHLMGTGYFHQNQVPLAKDAFSRAIQFTPNAEPFLSLCRCHLQDGDTKAAIFTLRRGVEMFPDDPQIVIKLGLLLRESGMVGKGNEKLLTLQHMAASTMNNLSMSLAVGSVLYDSKQDIDGALYRYKMANVFESGALWNNISLCFSARKKIVGAVSCGKRAIYLNPFEWRIAYNLGLIHLHMRQFASAFHFLKTAAAMSNGAPHVISLLALSLEHLKDEENANQAHLSAVKSAIQVSFPVPILNYAVFLYQRDRGSGVNRDTIVDLLMEFEKCWVKRKQNNGEFDSETMKMATRLATLMKVSQDMGWIKPVEETLSNQAISTNAIVEKGADEIEWMDPEKAIQYWETQPASIKGMLGGLDGVHSDDLQDSIRFLHKYFPNVNHQEEGNPSIRALDCGSGIGRVTLGVLSHFSHVIDLVEPVPSFIDESHEYLKSIENLVGHRYVVSAQNFTPPKGITYNIIWVQWVAPNLTDCEWVALLSKLKEILHPDRGMIFVKENVTEAPDDFHDERDHSITRSKDHLIDLMSNNVTGLYVDSTEKQTNYPFGLFPLWMFSLKTRSQK